MRTVHQHMHVARYSQPMIRDCTPVSTSARARSVEIMTPGYCASGGHRARHRPGPWMSSPRTKGPYDGHVERRPALRL